MVSPLEGYTANIDRLDALHALGLNDSEEADAVRNQMDCQWRAMTQVEQGIANRYAEQATEAERITSEKCMHADWPGVHPFGKCMHAYRET